MAVIVLVHDLVEPLSQESLIFHLGHIGNFNGHECFLALKCKERGYAGDLQGHINEGGTK